MQYYMKFQLSLPELLRKQIFELNEERHLV